MVTNIHMPSSDIISFIMIINIKKSTIIHSFIWHSHCFQYRTFICKYPFFKLYCNTFILSHICFIYICKCVRHISYIPLYKRHPFFWQINLAAYTKVGLIYYHWIYILSFCKYIIRIFRSVCFFSNQIIKPIIDNRNGCPYIPAILCDI